ncbi:MAG: ATP-grasp domain-containing protein [Rhodocyclaceae bacterium]|nr:ATP-grasp domain-containing protein [Rhodocyclaceae bacterium]
MISAAPGAALRLVDLRATLGRSLYCDFPAVVGHLELTGGDPPDPLRLASRLRALLAPFGANEGEGVGRDVDAHVLAGDDPATGLARCVAALAGYLQEMAGGPGRPAFGRRAGEGRAVAACPYELRDAGLEAMRFACSLVERLLSGAREEPDRLREEIVRFTRAMAALHLDPYGRALAAAGRQRGIPAYRLGANGRYLQLGQGCRQVHFLETTSDRGSPVGVKLAGNKPAALELLHRLGLPVPEGGLADTAGAACRLAESLGFPVVVKPTHGMSGRGVSVGLRSAAEVERAHAVATEYGAGAVRVERHVPGQDYRLLVIGGRLASVVRRTPAHVIGDGVQTVDELRLALNRSRQDDPRGLLRPVPRDAEAARMLAAQGLDFPAVPETGRMVFLRGAANIAAGGSAQEVADAVHPELRRMAETAARAFHLDMAGLDFLTMDIHASPRESGGAFCEINPFPALRPHWLAGDAAGRVERAILAFHFPEPDDGRIPLALVTGSSGKSTTARMLAAILQAGGRKVGLACSDGCYAEGHRYRTGDCAGGPPARDLLLQPAIDAAVIELGRGGLLRAGVPVDACAVAAVLGVHGDHLGQDGIDDLAALAALKALPLRAARDRIVLNADDPACIAMAAAARPLPVCWFSVAGGPGRPPATPGDWLLALDGAGPSARLVWHAPAPLPLLEVGDIPATRNGLVGINVTNALAAAAIALSMGIPAETVGLGLRGFRGDHEDNPGRCNLLRGPGGTILLDRPDSPVDMAALAALAATFPVAGRRILLLTAPGNRPDAHVVGMGRAAGGAFDAAFLYTWQDPRGRRPGEVPALLREGLLAAGMREPRIARVPDQAEAIARSLEDAGPADLLVLVCLDQGPALDDLWRRLKRKVGTAD